VKAGENGFDKEVGGKGEREGGIVFFETE